MPGQATVTIKDKRWSVTIANTLAELTSGLSGVKSLPPQTGMLFDLGYDQKYIAINMSQMLFPLDIIFINSTQGVVGVLQNVPPGLNAYLNNEQLPGARAFLEVNADEAKGIVAGDPVTIQGYAQTTTSTPGIDINSIMNLMLIMVVMVMMMKMMDSALAPPKAKLKLPPGYVYLPASEDAEHLLRRLDAEQKDLWNRACDWDKIPRDSKFIMFSPDNPYAKKRNEVMIQLQKYRRLIQAGGGLQHRPGPQSLSSTWSRSPQTKGNYDKEKEYVKIIAPGKTYLTIGSVVTREELERENKKARERGEQPATAEVWEGGKPVMIRPKVIPTEKTKAQPDKLEYLADSPEFLTQTIEDIGYRDKLDSAFGKAIARAKGLK